MRKLLLLAWLIWIPASAIAQHILRGKVSHKLDGKAMAGINLVVKDRSAVATLGYGTTDQNGNYQIGFNSAQDSVTLLLTGFNIEKQQFRLANRSQVRDIMISQQPISLKEVKIVPPKIRKVGDTINYRVDGFGDQNDRTIAQVLSKMPGIEVKADGSILYRNKPINKFYIEDKDLLQGRYGIATNNIQAKDVAVVQVLENHQPVRALKDREFSEEAAINLKLKDEAKGTLVANGKLGLGLPPLLWNNDLVAMRFNKRNQQIHTYGGNNTGTDPGADLKLQYPQAAGTSSPIALGIQSPNTPPIAQNRYLFNRAHVLAVNELFTVGKDNQLNINLNYLNDHRQKRSFSRSSYFLPMDSVLSIAENLSSSERISELAAMMKFNRNKESSYLDNQLEFTGNWNNSTGTIGGPGQVLQKLNNPSFGLKNNFSVVKNTKRSTLRISSQQFLQHLPHSLEVRPFVGYEGILSVPLNALGLRQQLGQRQYLSTNRLSVGRNNKNWKQNYAAGINMNSLQMNSNLLPILEGYQTTADSMANKLHWNKYDLYLSSDLTFVRQKLKVTASLPLIYTMLNTTDRLLGKDQHLEGLFLNRSLSVSYDLNLFTSLTASARSNGSIGEIGNGFTGLIMQSYRNLVRSDGQLPVKRDQSYNLNLYYRHPVHAVFVNLSANYFSNRSNLLYAYQYQQGAIAIKRSYAVDNVQQGHSFQGQLSKGVDAIGGALKLDIGFTRARGAQINQGELIRVGNSNLRFGPSLNAKVGPWASVQYHLLYAQSSNRISGSSAEPRPIRSASQTARLALFPSKGLTVNLTHEYLHLNGLSSDNRYMHFADLSIKYNLREMQFSISYENIFNAREYIWASLNETGSYYSVYELRPAQLLLGFRFKIK